MNQTLLRAAVCVLSALTGGAALSAQTKPYHVVKTIALGGEGGWDYLFADSAGQRLYVSHATRVEVVDLIRDTSLGVIPNTPGVHGIAIAPELGRGFTSNGRDSTVTIFDVSTMAAIPTRSSTTRHRGGCSP